MGHAQEIQFRRRYNVQKHIMMGKYFCLFMHIIFVGSLRVFVLISFGMGGKGFKKQEEEFDSRLLILRSTEPPLESLRI